MTSEIITNGGTLITGRGYISPHEVTVGHITDDSLEEKISKMLKRLAPPEYTGMRVLKPNGTLIFKWSEQEIPVSKILDAIGGGIKPMYGHKSGKLQKTHWMAFMKGGADE